MRCSGWPSGLAPGLCWCWLFSNLCATEPARGSRWLGRRLTDPFIIVVALVALNQFGEVQGFLGGASLLGAGVLAYLASGSLTFDGAVHWTVAVRARAIRKGCS